MLVPCKIGCKHGGQRQIRGPGSGSRPAPVSTTVSVCGIAASDDRAVGHCEISGSAEEASPCVKVGSVRWPPITLRIEQVSHWQQPVSPFSPGFQLRLCASSALPRFPRAAGSYIADYRASASDVATRTAARAAKGRRPPLRAEHMFVFLMHFWPLFSHVLRRTRAAAALHAFPGSAVCNGIGYRNTVRRCIFCASQRANHDKGARSRQISTPAASSLRAGGDGRLQNAVDPSTAPDSDRILSSDTMRNTLGAKHSVLHISYTGTRFHSDPDPDSRGLFADGASCAKPVPPYQSVEEVARRLHERPTRDAGSPATRIGSF